MPTIAQAMKAVARTCLHHDEGQTLHIHAVNSCLWRTGKRFLLCLYLSGVTQCFMGMTLCLPTTVIVRNLFAVVLNVARRPICRRADQENLSLGEFYRLDIPVYHGMNQATR